MDDSPGENVNLYVIVLECMDLFIGQRVNVSRLSCVSNKILGCWNSYKGVICDLIHHLPDPDENQYFQSTTEMVKTQEVENFRSDYFVFFFLHKHQGRPCKYKLAAS